MTNTSRYTHKNINKDKWNHLIDEEIKYSVDAGFRHDQNSFIQELEENNNSLDWRAFPIAEIVSRKWISAKTTDIAENSQYIFEQFVSLIGNEDVPQKILLRKTLHKNSNILTNDYALLAWSIRVLSKAIDSNIPNTYNPEIINFKFLKEVVQFSQYQDGPLQVQGFLANHGISLIIEKHLTGTKFNGASLMTSTGIPVVGLTLLYDRVDNFWFTLTHELAHVWKHLHGNDDLYIDFFGGGDENHIDSPEEQEADKIARDTLIPANYLSHIAFVSHSNDDVEQLAKELNIHPAIIAGRIRYDNQLWNKLGEYVNGRSVRLLFKDSGWW